MGVGPGGARRLANCILLDKISNCFCWPSVLLHEYTVNEQLRWKKGSLYVPYCRLLTCQLQKVMTLTIQGDIQAANYCNSKKFYMII